MDTVTDEHTVSAVSERHYIRNPAGDMTVRWRGRCSCGARSFMHYATAKAAKVALRRTHLQDSDDSTQTKEQ
jgi:hypothetical protein